MSLLPKPPDPKTPGEFAQIVFIIVIALVIIISAVGVAVVEIMDPDTDTNDIVILIAVIIAALFGFVAGRVSIREEIFQEREQ